MKKYVWMAVLLIVIAFCVTGGIFYFGNQPLITRYANGQIKSSTPRRFFVPDGLASFYHENGTLAYQYNFKNGIKNGEGFLYISGQPVKFYYQNGVISGPVTLEQNAFFKDVGIKPKITFLPQNKIEVLIDDDTFQTRFEADNLCSDDDLLAQFSNYGIDFARSKLGTLLECFLLTNAEMKDEGYGCNFEGGYKYPALTRDFALKCHIDYHDETSQDNQEILLTGDYELASDNLIIKGSTNEDTDSRISLSYKGLKPIVEGVSKTLVNAPENQYAAKILELLVENLTSLDADLIVNDKKVWDVSGSFNMMKGFSDPYYFSSYINNDLSSQVKITKSGINLKALYPLSKKPMFSLGLNVGDTFGATYHELMQQLRATLADSYNQKTDTASNVLENMMEETSKISNLFKSAYATLYNNKGQKVLAGNLSLKSGVSPEVLMFNPMVALSANIITYQDGKPNHNITGDEQSGFLIDGYQADEESVLAYIYNENVQQALDDIRSDLEQTIAPMVENAASSKDLIGIDPLFVGMYSGYVKAMFKKEVNATIDEIAQIVVNTEAVYQDKENYAGLDEQTAVEFNIVPEEMIGDDGDLYNLYGGQVFVRPSQALKKSTALDAFVVILTNLPSNVCKMLAVADWSAGGANFIGVSAAKAGVADVSKAYWGEDFEGRSSGLSYDMLSAQEACGEDDTASVALKFY